MTTYGTRTRRWTRAEYERLIELGVFRPGDPVELIGGELMVAEPQGAEHYTAIRRSARRLEVAFGPGWEVRTQGPIGLDDESEPEPDVAVVPGSPDDYRNAHPSRSVLTLEVAQSSLAIDRERKGSLYARAGLTDYWVLNLVDRVLEVFKALREGFIKGCAALSERGIERIVFRVHKSPPFQFLSNLLCLVQECGLAPRNGNFLWLRKLFDNMRKLLNNLRQFLGELFVCCLKPLFRHLRSILRLALAAAQ